MESEDGNRLIWTKCPPTNLPYFVVWIVPAADCGDGGALPDNNIHSYRPFAVILSTELHQCIFLFFLFFPFFL